MDSLEELQKLEQLVEQWSADNGWQLCAGPRSIWGYELLGSRYAILTKGRAAFEVRVSDHDTRPSHPGGVAVYLTVDGRRPDEPGVLRYAKQLLDEAAEEAEAEAEEDVDDD